MDMTEASLSESLERFNRKERNLLVRDILGQESEKLPPLSKAFCTRITAALGIEVSESAWWAADYHISWLAGALAIYVKKSVKCCLFPNPFWTPVLDDANAEQPKRRQLVEGNQEDIDLVIAMDQNLILIEAKAYGSFTERQIKSKLERLNMLHRFLEESLKPETDQRIQSHFMLQGPSDPKHLKFEWPRWACNTREKCWLDLKIGESDFVLEVTRCNSNGRSTAKGDSWKVF